MTLALAAPAKLNLFLHVVGRRADGYHFIQSCARFIDLCDTVTLRTRRDGAVRRVLGPAGVAEADDLAVRAALLLKERAATGLGVEIAIEKRIPLGGGLGGGSSDAAAVLVGLDRLWGLGLGTAALAELGLALGSDVPLFVDGRASWIEGVGERLSPVTLDPAWYLVLVPDAQVSTREMYQAPELTRDSPAVTLRALFAGQTGNAFEPVVRARYPQVDAALHWLSRHARACLTGSGGCVFAAFGARAEAERVLAQRPTGWRGLVAEGLDRSPLHGSG
jgi:4-diphosphocytidyl-2-C-methyl-D-erythritol kinase